MNALSAFLTALVLALAGAACGGGAGANGEAGTRLEISVLTGDRQTHEFELRCEPAGGNASDPASACALLQSHPEMLAVPELTGTCAGSAGIPPDITVEGESDGRAVAVGVRECDLPEARAASARLWLEALELAN